MPEITLKSRLSANERANLAKAVLETCLEEELDMLYKSISPHFLNLSKRVFLSSVWGDGKRKFMIVDSREAFQKESQGLTGKTLALDYSGYLALSWPFEILPLAAGKYSDITNKVIQWRLHTGR